MLKFQHRSYITNIISSANDKKPFWQYIKTKKQENVGINTLKSADRKAITSASEKANILKSISNQCLLLKTAICFLANQFHHIHPWLILKSPLREYTTFELIQISRFRQSSSLCTKSHLFGDCTNADSLISTIIKQWHTTGTMEACLCNTHLQ